MKNDVKGKEWLGALIDNGFTLDPHPQKQELLAKGLLAAVPTKPKVADGKKGVYADGSGLVTFVDDLDAQSQQDMLDAWEFSNRYADKQIHTKYGLTDPKNQNTDTKFTHTIEWYTHLGVALNKLHFTAQDFDFAGYTASGDTFTVDKMIIDVMMTMLGDDAEGASALKDALNLIQSVGKDDSSMTIWDSHSKSQSSGSMQKVMVQQKAPGSPLSLKTGAFGIVSQATITDVLFFFHFSTSKTSVAKATQDMVFNQDLYSTSRDLVRKLIGEDTNDWLNGIGSI